MTTAYDAVPAFPRAAASVTPSDSTTFETPSMVYVGGAGNVAVMPWEGVTSVTFTVPAGGYVPLQVRQVLSTGTTATGLVRVF